MDAALHAKLKLGIHVQEEIFHGLILASWVAQSEHLITVSKLALMQTQLILMDAIATVRWNKDGNAQEVRLQVLINAERYVETHGIWTSTNVTMEM